jgi:hypothetical protein
LNIGYTAEWREERRKDREFKTYLPKFNVFLTIHSDDKLENSLLFVAVVGSKSEYL